MLEFIDFNKCPSGEISSPEEIETKIVDEYINNIKKQIIKHNNLQKELNKETLILTGKLNEFYIRCNVKNNLIFIEEDK